jgi:hypothetical protein
MAVEIGRRVEDEASTHLVHLRAKRNEPRVK